MYEQEWISPILEVFKKRKITDRYVVILGLNPLGQTLCRQIYEAEEFETVLVFSSPNYSIWNRYPSFRKPPVIPVQAMVNDDFMLIFGDVYFRDYEWFVDMLFYLRGNVPMRFLIAMMTHNGPTCGQVVSRKGKRLLRRMEIPSGHSDYYDGLTAPLASLGGKIGLEPVIVFLDKGHDSEILIQIDDTEVTQDQVDRSRKLLELGLELRPE